jgi:NAD(P)-dependent dehydrogenase (short-subunit alcohol dehydrogenase family)
VRGHAARHAATRLRPHYQHRQRGRCRHRPGLAAYCVSKHALGALTEVIQDANHDNGIKAWVICPGFVDTEMGDVVPGANRGSYLDVDEIVDVARYLIRLGDNVKLGPQILVRTMRNPMAT